MKKSRRRSRPGLKSSQKIFFPRYIKSLQQKWAKCIELLGDCIEKLKIFFCDKLFLSYSGRYIIERPTYIHKATAQFHSADITGSIQNVVKFIPYTYQYLRQRCASMAAQYLDVTEIHISNAFVSYKTVLLSDIKLHLFGVKDQDI